MTIDTYRLPTMNMDMTSFSESLGFKASWKGKKGVRTVM